MSIREFLDALRSTQGQHTLASVLEGPESGCWAGISRRWPDVVQATS